LAKTAAVAAALVCIAGITFSSASAQVGGAGTYQDASGASHGWQINEAHTLVWEGKPYIPVGGMFCSRYLTDGQTDENWKADTGALKTLKSSGILDLYINPVKGATSCPREAWQKLIDFLEAEGFHYGIEITDGPQTPVSGWVIRPSVYRATDISADQTFNLQIPGMAGGLWAVADGKTGNLIRLKALDVKDARTTVDVRASTQSTRILILYPYKRLSTEETGLQDLWGGFGEYRDRLINHLKGLKLGPGFRFWVDPFINEMGLRGDARNFVPASRAYQIELEAWLRRRYPEISALTRAWSLPSDIRTHEQASHLIPLWEGYKGLPQVYDTTTGETYKLGNSAGRMWDDLMAFRDESIRGYLNQISLVLKREVANVPVVVKAVEPYSFLINDDTNGFDGIGVEAYAPPGSLGTQAANLGIAVAEQASRNMWVLATETQTTASSGKAGQGYANQQEMTASLAALKDAGCKGFYVFGLQLLPQKSWGSFELVRVPEQLGWLKAFQDRLASDTLLGDWRARTVWFSESNPCGASISRLEQDLWWLPKKGAAEEIPLDTGLHAYSISDAMGTAVYLWTTGASRDVEIPLPGGMRPMLFFTGADGRAAKYVKKKVTIPVSRNPVIIRGIPPGGLLTTEGLLSRVAYLQTLIDRAEAMTPPLATGEQKMALDTAKTNIKADRASIAAPAIAHAIAQLEPAVAPFDWEEGENASETNFDGIGDDPAASGNKYLRLYATADPPLAPYMASYPVYASQEADYDLWLAGTPPGIDWVSPLSWSVDGSNWVKITAPATQAQPYAPPSMFWSKLATLHMTQGKHVVRLRVDGRRKAPDDRYVMYIDAVLITREPFRPDGIRRPGLQ